MVYGLRMTAKLSALRDRLAALPSAVVCFSGGVDSAFVLAAAHEVLGERVVALTAISASVSESERTDARSVAGTIGVEHLCLDSREMDDPRYVANPVNRCYYCKSELYRLAWTVARDRGFTHVLNGTNCDDLGDVRPGLDAAREAGVVSPLVDTGFTKNDVREGARALGLDVWDKPAAACLASRLPFGTAVTSDRLTRVATSERALRSMGLRQVRVRYHDELARIEVGAGEMERAFELRDRIVESVRLAGFTYVVLDLQGYRTGSHNEAVRLPIFTG